MAPGEAVVKDLDALPTPDRSLLNPDAYKIGKKRFTQILSTRGCPKRCEFCSLPNRQISIFRKRTIKLNNIIGYWFKIIEDSWTIFKIEMEELFSRIGDAALFFVQFLVMYFTVMLPLRLVGAKPLSEIGALFFASMLNVSAIFQFADAVLGRIRSGVYEALRLALKSMLSLYLANLYSAWVLIIVFVMGFLPAALEGSLVIDVPLFLVAFILTLLSNAGISIIIAGIHIAYRPIRELRGLVGFVLYFLFAYGIPYCLQNEPWRRIILILPQAHSISLIMYSLTAHKITLIDPVHSILYLIVFSIVTVPPSLKMYMKAERIAKKYGFAELRR